MIKEHGIQTLGWCAIDIYMNGHDDKNCYIAEKQRNKAFFGWMWQFNSLQGSYLVGTF